MELVIKENENEINFYATTVSPRRARHRVENKTNKKTSNRNVFRRFSYRPYWRKSKKKVTKSRNYKIR